MCLDPNLFAPWGAVLIVMPEPFGAWDVIWSQVLTVNRSDRQVFGLVNGGRASSRQWRLIYVVLRIFSRHSHVAIS